MGPNPNTGNTCNENKRFKSFRPPSEVELRVRGGNDWP